MYFVSVFVQSKDRAKQLFKELIYDGINVDVIHADRTQTQVGYFSLFFFCSNYNSFIKIYENRF